MKTLNIILISALLVIIGIGCFIGGVFYADKTSSIPKDGNYELEGCFTNIKKSELTIFDNEYLYFTKGTGATES